MNLSRALFLLVPASLAAQAPELRVTPAARPGEVLDTIVLGHPGQPFVTLVDIAGGPRAALGQVFHLALSNSLTALDSGVLGLAGFHTLSLTLPRQAPVGVPLYFQTVVGGDRLGLTDGESAVAYQSSRLLVQDFTDPVAMGMVGDYDTTVRGRVQAAAPRRRTQDVVPRQQGIPFPTGVLGSLNPFGVRQQSVYRAADVGASGAVEVLTAVRWKPVGQVSFDAIGQFELRVSHSRVVPDFTIDPFSALPLYPNSGLSLQLADNVKPSDQPVTVYSGGYIVDPRNQRSDGYMPYPDLQHEFRYNGFDSLLLDFVVPPSTSNGSNGQQVYVMVQSSPQPNARAFTAGRSGRLVTNPDRIAVAEQGDNSWFEVQLDFLCPESRATSPWLRAPSTSPDYHTPFVSTSNPLGGNIALEFRGATRPDGGDATPWSPSIDAIDRMEFLQYRIRFFAPASGGLLPSVDQIVIPVD
ncbi:MAG: hypothetical protein R3F56_12955 [Planctomycetota bacterium]